MQIILLSFLGLVLLIFCVVDLYHLRQMLKNMRNINNYLKLLTEYEQMKLKWRK